MKICKVNENEYDFVFDLGKKLLNFDSLLTQENQIFNDNLCAIVVNEIIKNATNGYFIKSDDDFIIGVLIYTIPNREILFKNIQNDLPKHYQNWKEYLQTNMLNTSETIIVNKEVDIMNAFKELSNSYQNLLVNKAEINLLYIEKKHRNKFLSKFLFLQFANDLLSSNYHSFFLYTTSEYNYFLYEKIGMKGVRKTIYDYDNAPLYIQFKHNLPYFAMLYFGNIKDLNL
ncbi:MAG: hypothetical protein HUJ42_03460 [Malacoplasma sp.]|nr:hypothetical protein [Malacoplasma sp.]